MTEALLLVATLCGTPAVTPPPGALFVELGPGVVIVLDDQCLADLSAQGAPVK